MRDVLQETFLTYYLKRPQFKSAEHRKAWLIKVSQNKCREFLRFHKRHATVSLESIDENACITKGLSDEEKDLLAMIWGLNYKLKSVVLLYYIEGYSVEETAGMLGLSVSATKKRLERARKQIKAEYEGGFAYEG